MMEATHNDRDKRDVTLITTSELAERIDASPTLIRKWRQRGWLPAPLRKGARNYWPFPDVVIALAPVLKRRREWELKRRHKLQRRGVLALPPWEHGFAEPYAKGCRCEECVREHRITRLLSPSP